MVVFALMAALSNPDLVTLRYDNLQASWDICIDNRLEGLAQAAEEGLPRSAQVTIAMDQCYVFEQDFKRSLPDVVIKHLNESGTTNVSPRVVDLMVEETLKVVSESIRTSKEGR